MLSKRNTLETNTHVNAKVLACLFKKSLGTLRYESHVFFIFLCVLLQGMPKNNKKREENRRKRWRLRNSLPIQRH